MSKFFCSAKARLEPNTIEKKAYGAKAAEN